LACYNNIMHLRLFILFLLALCVKTALPTHYMGGEITWECLSNGKYKFRMKCYRECAGIDYSQIEELTVTNYPSVGSTFYIQLTRVSRTDISPVCNSAFPGISCATTSVPNTGGVEEHVYESGEITLSGVPPPQGWIFSWGDCCRNPSSNIANATSKSWTLRAVMYAYNGQNANPCYDNSPTFAEPPSPVLPVGYPFTYNHNAYDSDMDSLAFEWATPLEGGITSPISGWQPGYSYQSPLPGTSHNPSNVPASINPYTGEIRFTSYTQGAFINVVKVSSYRCGVLIAEVFREMQVVLTPIVNANNPPVCTAPFYNPATGLFDSYTDTVYAGDIVQFLISGEDYDQLPNAELQTMTITASGSQFGSGYTSTTTGCVTPPCATLDPPPPVIGQYYVATQFRWETSCEHIVAMATTGGCLVNQHVYTFVIKVKDDDCPVPGINFITITIVVLAKPVLPAPELLCTQVLDNGGVTLTWQAVENDTLNSFYSYEIHTSNSPTGPFSRLDSVFNINQTSYTHMDADANSGPRYYYIKTRSSCYGLFYSDQSNTIASMHLEAIASSASSIDLTWNPPHSPLSPGSQLPYRIYKEQPAGVWNQIGTSNTENYTDNDIDLAPCMTGNFRYHIGLSDASSCISTSSIAEETISVEADVVNPPELRCVQVDELGDIDLFWLIDSEEGSFVCYYVYSALQAAGPYVLIDSIFDFNITTYRHNAANAQNQSRFYYLQVKYGCNADVLSPTSDTLQSMLLQVNPTGGIANLSWNPIHEPSLPSSANVYRVFRKTEIGNWDFLSTVSTTQYNDTIQVCDNQISYRIELEDASGCFSISSIAVDNFSDEIPPLTPVIDSVSVDNTNGNVIIAWNINPSADATAYVVYQFNPTLGAYEPLDTIWGRYTTSYIHTSANASAGSNTYTVAAIDSCGNISSYSQPHHSMFLQHYLDVCSQTGDLFWKKYINLSGGVNSYYVMVAENGGNYQILQNLSPSDSTFAIGNLQNNTTYCIYIQAANASQTHTSSSNQVCFTLTLPSIPSYCYIRFASVYGSNQVDLAFVTDNPQTLSKLEIQRADTTGSNFQIIDYIYNPASNELYYTDMNANTDEIVHYYRLQAIDSCGNPVLVSNTVRTILLRAEAKMDMTNLVNWTPYVGWPTEVFNYQIHREIDEVPEAAPCHTVGYDTLMLSDEVSSLYEAEGRFCYYVEASENFGNPLGYRDISMSNKVCINQFPRFFVPNAFVPVGYNRTFKPMTVFVDKTDYLFQIYSRWGERIFETTDSEMGWDGRYKGKNVQSGAYTYYFRYRNSEGYVIEKTGSVTLLR